MQGTARRPDDRASSTRDRAPLIAAVVVTVAVHVAMGLAFALLDESVEPPPAIGTGAGHRGRILCANGRRCPALGWPRGRLEIDQGPLGDVLVAQIIPALGMAQQDPKKLPQLQKYEQPEKIEEGVNIQRENPPPVEPPKPKEFEAKPEQRDRRSKVPLSQILGPDSKDPRRRATRLDAIIGQPDGLPTGQGAEWGEGDRWAGEVQLKLMEQFRVPASIDTRTLRSLKVEIVIRKISSSGAIEGFEVRRRSTNEPYNTAAVQLIKKFMPAEGGSLRLPPPEPKVLAKVNRDGMLVTLDGQLFRGR